MNVSFHRPAGLSALCLGLLLFAGRAHATKPLDVIVLMDNSETMAGSDTEYFSVAASGLLIDLIRPEDRLYLISCGATSSVVLEAKGDEKEKIRTSIGMMKRESSANDFVDALRSVKKQLLAIKKEKGGGGKTPRKTLVVWFMSSELRLNVKHKSYLTTDKAKSLWAMAKKGGLDKSPFKKREVRDLHKEILGEASRQALELAAELGKKGVALNVFIMGKSLGAPGIQGSDAQKSLEDVVAATGGRMAFWGSDAGGLILDSIVSIFVEKISAPTITVNAETYNPKGESFEVYRKSRYLWALVLFKTVPPKKMAMVASDYATEKVKKWPFGKRLEDVLFKKAEFEKGEIFRGRRWYKPPSNPAGYGLFVISNPVEGVYRATVQSERGEEFELRVFQDIDLEFGFLTQPSGSIPIGTAFTAIAGLKSPDGGSFTFHRSFLGDLDFKVEMEREGGGVPDWGEPRQAKFSKEGEVLMSFEPASPGMYIVRGEVTHKNQEFKAALSPFKVEVYRRVKIEFVKKNLAWDAPPREGQWISIDPGIELKPDVSIPADLVFDLQLDWSKVSNHEKLEIRPKKFLKIMPGKKSYPMMIRYKDSGSLRLKGETFEGPLRITVREDQKRNVSGSGSWVIKVRGRASPWSFVMYWNEYIVLANVLLVLLIVAILAVERTIRPSFGRNLALSIVRKSTAPGGTATTITLGAMRKPILPFRLQRVRIGVDGSVNTRHAQTAAMVIATGRSFTIVPVHYTIRFVQGGIAFTAHTKFPGKTDEKYVMAEGSDEIEFWFEIE